MESTDQRCYAGLRVLDMSQGMAGPYCAAVLAQHGADVIKIEPPEGDWIRVMGGGKDGMSALAITNNLGKRSICIDAAKPEGRALVLKMAQRADVFVENFRAGVMAKLGLDYTALADANPRLIYLSISGFGETGPDAHKPATDSVVQGLSGMAIANKDAAGEPRRIGVLVPDTVTGLYSAQCVGAALYARDRQPGSGGRGRHIRISLAECCAAFQAAPILDDFLFSGRYKPPTSVPAGVFATRDGHVVLTTLRDSMWQGLCRALAREDWLAEPRYASGTLRGENAEEINREVAGIMRSKDTQDWALLFERHDVLFGRVQNYAEFRSHPQIRHMGYFATAEQAPFGAVPIAQLPGTERSATISAAPLRGEHSRQILAEFGYSEADATALAQAGLVFQAS